MTHTPFVSNPCPATAIVFVSQNLFYGQLPHVGVFLFWSGRRGSTRYRHPTNGRAIRRSPAGPLDSTRFAPVEAASSSLPATFQKENTILTDGVSFCDYPQVLLFAPSHIARKGECEGETFAGFPTRVQSPARRRQLFMK